MLFRRATWIIEDFASGNHGGGAQEAFDGIGQRRFNTRPLSRKAQNFSSLEGEAYISYSMYCAVRRQVIDIEMFHFEERIGRNSCLIFRYHYATIFLASRVSWWVFLPYVFI